MDLGWIGGGLDGTPSSDYVILPLAQVHLLGKGHGPLSFRSRRVACGGALSGTLGRLLCKRLLRSFPLTTAPVVRCMFSPATTAVGLLPRGTASIGEVGAPTRNTPGSVSAVTLYVPEALATLVLQWAFWGYVRIHRHSQAAELGE